MNDRRAVARRSHLSSSYSYSYSPPMVFEYEYEDERDAYSVEIVTAAVMFQRNCSLNSSGMMTTV